MNTIPTALLILIGLGACALMVVLIVLWERAEKAELEKHIKWLEERENSD